MSLVRVSSRRAPALARTPAGGRTMTQPHGRLLAAYKFQRHASYGAVRRACASLGGFAGLARRRPGQVLAEPEHVREGRELVVGGGCKVRELGYHRVR
jgi:hypothetical protein